MGQVRNMLRGIAHALDAPPAAALSALDRALSGLGITTLVTAVMARVEQTPDRAAADERVLRWSNAGHPPPLLLRADGTVELLERPRNLLLGVDVCAERAEHAVPLRSGDTVVLYTDGLVERRDWTLDEGLDRLVAVAGELAARPVDELCDALLGRLAPDASDDVALLVLRVSAVG
jgi:serine phosphatase RsbU (regulator of sigma subunit)